MTLYYAIGRVAVSAAASWPRRSQEPGASRLSLVQAMSSWHSSYLRNFYSARHGRLAHVRRRAQALHENLGFGRSR